MCVTTTGVPWIGNGDVHSVEISASGHVAGMMRRQVDADGKIVDEGPDAVTCFAGYTCSESDVGKASCACCYTEMACNNIVGAACGWMNGLLCAPAPIWTIPGDMLLSSDYMSGYVNKFPNISGDDTSQDFINLSTALSSLSTGSGVGVMFSATWGAYASGSTLVELGIPTTYASSQTGNNIILGQYLNTNHFLFRVFYGVPRIADIFIKNVIVQGSPLTLLCTVASNGTMRVWSNGEIVRSCSPGTESSPSSPCSSSSPQQGTSAGISSYFAQGFKGAKYTGSFIGKSNDVTRAAFTGTVTDLRIWNQAVDWNQAFGLAAR